MRHARLTLALESGGLVLPDAGTIAVFGPRAGDDLSALPIERVQVIQGFWPDHEAFRLAGYSTATAPSGPCAAGLVCLPRSKAEARALIAQAAASVAPGGPVLVDGQKTDGADALLRECRARLPVGDAVSKAHGKLFWFAAAPVFADWQAAGAVRGIGEGFVAAPGMFSADGIDRGSALLASALPAKLGGRVADLGSGWGYLSRAVLTRDGVRALHLIEADHAALDCARLNITDPRAAFHWADATRFKPAQKFDTVVTNPPFHVARAADPALGAAFIRAAAAMLTAGGVLWVVANRHLPYERVLADAFREVEETGGDAAFKITRAARPVPPVPQAVAASRATR